MIVLSFMFMQKLIMYLFYTEYFTSKVFKINARIWKEYLHTEIVKKFFIWQEMLTSVPSFIMNLWRWSRGRDKQAEKMGRK